MDVKNLNWRKKSGNRKWHIEISRNSSIQWERWANFMQKENSSQRTRRSASADVITSDDKVKPVSGNLLLSNLTLQSHWLVQTCSISRIREMSSFKVYEIIVHAFVSSRWTTAMVFSPAFLRSHLAGSTWSKTQQPDYYLDHKEEYTSPPS